MNILNQFTARSLKLNKKRTIVTIIGIMLSTALICATAGLISSFQETLIKRAIQNTGDYHTAFMNIKQEQQKYITQNRNVEDYMITQNIGYSKLEGSTNKFKPYLFLKGYNKNAIEKLPIRVKEGRLPQKEDEIIIAEHIISNGEVDLKIGDKLKLKVGKRYSEEHELTQNNPCYEYPSEEGDLGDSSSNTIKINENEQIKEEFEKEYTIVGKMARPDYEMEPYNAPGYTVITFISDTQQADSVNVYVKYTTPKDAYNITKDIKQTLDSTMQEGNYNTKYNTSLLTWLGATKQDNTQTVVYSLAVVVIGIIVVTSVFVIRNSFSISVTEKFKQYGILASIGATPKQIKHNVLYEGMLIALVAIPLGIVGAMLAVWVLVMLLNGLIGEFWDVAFTFKMSIPAIGISVLMSMVTIYLSCLLPAKKAGKISPIDAIRSTNDIKIKAKKIKSPKVIRKLFKIGGELSWKNLKRSKKKYRTTVISIVVSIVVFLSLSSVLQYGFKISGIYYEELPYNIAVENMRDDVKGEKSKIYNEIKNIDKAERYSHLKTMSIYIEEGTYKSKDYKNEDYMIQGEVKWMYVTIASVGKEEYSRYLKTLGLNETMTKDKAILYDKTTYYKDNKYYEGSQTILKEGDKVQGNTHETLRQQINNQVEYQEGKESEINLEIVKKVEELPMGVRDYNITLIVSDELFDKIKEETKQTSNRESLYIYSSKPYELEKEIEELGYKDKIQVYNYEENKRENDSMILIVYIFLYGFISVITLIGVTNIFNTITTNMALRSKEFAMLKSIGMTQKEFNKMIRLESIFYGAKSLLYGLPIGLGLSYWIYHIITDKYQLAYQIPFMQIALCVSFVFIIVFVTMKYSLSKINKQNIIETIRNENI